MNRIVFIINKQLNERLIIALFFIGLILYFIFYGLYISMGFHRVYYDTTLLIVLIPLFLVDVLKVCVESFSSNSFYTGEEELDKITVIIPTYNGEDVLEATIQDLLKKFKMEQIIVSSNGSTDKTQSIALDLGVILIDTKEPIGKVRAINVALASVKTEYCLILDDDVLIGSARIPIRTIGKECSGIAFRVFPKVTNFVTRIQDYEYRKSMDIGKVFHNNASTVQNISGAIGVLKTTELVRQIDIHNGEFCGEDLQRTLLLHRSQGNKGVVIVDSIVKTEVPDTIFSLFRQRIYGWCPGLYSNLNNYFNVMLRKRTPITLKYDAFYNIVFVVFTDPLRIVALPILLFYPFFSIAFYIIYVILESVAYFKLKRPVPFYIVLVYPFYGVFNFLTRVIAFGVYLYRRFTVKVAGLIYPDDYKQASTLYKVWGIYLSQVVLAVTFFATFYVIKPHIAQKLIRHSYAEIVNVDISKIK